MSDKKDFPEFIADSSGFGAEDGDLVVEICEESTRASARMWRITGSAGAARRAA